MGCFNAAHGHTQVFTLSHHRNIVCSQHGFEMVGDVRYELLLKRQFVSMFMGYARKLRQAKHFIIRNVSY